MDRYDLGYYYGRSLKPDTMVIVKTLDEEIAGLALLILEGDRIVIEMLSRNILLNVPGTGDQLLRCIEEYVAEQLDINEICLESLDREKLVSFYSRRGYIRSGPSTYDRDWGVLHPMTKRIVSIRN